MPEIEFPVDHKLPVREVSPAESRWTARSWLVWEKRRLISRIGFRALIVSTLLAVLIPSSYESKTRIMPPEQNDSGAMLALLAGRVVGGSGSGSGSGSGAASPGLASLAGNFLGMKTSGALFVDLVHSRTVQDHVANRLNLKKVYWARYEQDARKILDSRTEVTEDRKSGVISIDVTDRNPQRARDIAQAYVEELDHLVSQVSTSSARRERVFIEQRMAAVKGDLEDAEKQFSAFASKNTALDIKEQAKAMVEAAAMLQGQLIAAQSELQGLEQIYTPSNIRVRTLKARVGEIQRQLEKFGGTDASLAPDASSQDDIYPSIRKLPLLGVQWADLYRRMRIQETVYELLNQQYEITRIQEAKEIPTIRLIDPPELPEKKSWPPRLLIILMLTLSTVAGAICWVIAADQWQQVDVEDSRKLLVLTIWERARVRAERVAVRLRLNRLGTFSRRFRREPSDYT
jgi:capsule polysaccharide export protein KpsE/RkpR